MKQLKLDGRKSGTDDDRYRSKIFEYVHNAYYPTGDAAAVYSQ